jgi:MurNAc alpha-1-phosphate uridylyltransferase
LRVAGVQKVVVNVHYLPGALEAHLAARANGLEVVISDERDLAQPGMEPVRAWFDTHVPDRYRAAAWADCE